MKKLLILGIISLTTILCFSQSMSDSLNLKIRIINISDYQIIKLVISDSIVIENVGPGCSSDFYKSGPIYDLFKYDLTFSKNKKTIFDPVSVQIKSYPIDFDGEQLNTKGVIEYILSIDKIKRRHYDITFKRKNIEL